MRPHCDGWCKESLITFMELVRDGSNHKRWYLQTAIVTAATCVTQNRLMDSGVSSRHIPAVRDNRYHTNQRKKTNTFFIAMSEGNNSPLNGPYGI